MAKRDTTSGELNVSEHRTVELDSQDLPAQPRSRMKSEFKGERSRSASVWTMTQAGRRSGAAMFRGRFCCCFALQAGVCMYSSMGLVQMICVFITNIGGEIHELDNGHGWVQFSVLYIYVVAMLAGFFLTYYGSIKPSLRCLRVGNWLVLVFATYWMIISSLSFVDKPNIIRSICIDRRCPETHWLVKTYFRTYGDDCDLGEDPLVDDGDFIEDKGKDQEDKERDDFGLEDSEPILPGDALTEHMEHTENVTAGKITLNINNSQPYPNPTKLSQKTVKPGLEGLDLISFETRLIGCAINTKLYRTLSIFAMISWAGFVIHGIIGVFMLIRKIRRASLIGDLPQGLTHVSFAQERKSRYNI